MSVLQFVVAAGLVALQLWAVAMLLPVNAMSRNMLGITIMLVALLALLEFYSILTVMPPI